MKDTTENNISDCAAALERDSNTTEQRYGIVMQAANTTMFEYDITTKQFILPDCDVIEYNVSNILENGPETFVKKGLIESSCVEDFLEMYRKIDAGEPFAKCSVVSVGADGALHDYELSLSTVYDAKHIPIRAFGLRKNISLVRKRHSEERLYEAVMSRASRVYELNLTKNRFISGHEKWGELVGVNQSDNYSDMVNEFGEKAVYPEDAEAYIAFCSPSGIMDAYQKGITQRSCEYRRTDEGGEYEWVRNSYRLYEDAETNDICAYFYVEDIDSQKKAELALRYKAEHDSLTGFYNKDMTEKLITEFLATPDAKIHKHAFIILDIDYFKSINDTFGHVFGDAVLSQTCTRVASLFRDGDILGRIGGDEFVVLMKNVYNISLASTKAEEICSLLCENYIQRGRAYHISASVGVAMYPMHGKSYNDLFAHSDAALYYSKNNGRNRYSIYSNIMELVETGKEFNTGGLLEARTFEDNITEYIFRILYEATDKESAISAVLSLIGKFFNVSRTYIFENSPDGCLTSNTYEWCNDGIASCMDSLQNCNYDSAYPYVENFNIDDIFYLPDVSCATPYLQSLFLPTHAQSILQFAVRKTGKYVGFIGFDQCDTLRVPTRKQISDCHIIAQILGSFVIDIRLQKQNDIIAQGDGSKC